MRQLLSLVWGAGGIVSNKRWSRREELPTRDTNSISGQHGRWQQQEAQN